MLLSMLLSSCENGKPLDQFYNEYLNLGYTDQSVELGKNKDVSVRLLNQDMIVAQEYANGQLKNYKQLKNAKERYSNQTRFVLSFEGLDSLDEKALSVQISSSLELIEPSLFIKEPKNPITSELVFIAAFSNLSKEREFTLSILLNEKSHSIHYPVYALEKLPVLELEGLVLDREG